MGAWGGVHGEGCMGKENTARDRQAISTNMHGGPMQGAPGAPPPSYATAVLCTFITIICKLYMQVEVDHPWSC